MFALIFALAAVLVAAITAFGLYTVLQGYQNQIQDARQSQEVRTVVAARADLVPGQPIEEGSLILVQIIAAEVPAESTFGELGPLIGTVPAERILMGEVIRREHLVEFAPKTDLAMLVTPGNRAISIQTDHAEGVGGLIVPGNWVDLLVTIRPDSGDLEANWVTETILQAVRVLAVGPVVLGAPQTDEAGSSIAKKPSGGTVVVTLEVTPEDAEKIALATSRGAPHLSLRNTNDVALIDSRGPLIANALIGISGATSKASPTRTAPQVRALPPRTDSAEVIEGSNAVRMKFDETGRTVVEPSKRR